MRYRIEYADGRCCNFANKKMIMMPEWRYNKMVESYDKAMEEIERLKKALELPYYRDSPDRTKRGF